MGNSKFLDGLNSEQYKELTRKLIEFGYLDDTGKVVKQYKVTTLEVIQELKKKGK